ncbi:MAG: histidinol-phosphatase [Pseudomonadota bacterium]|nr:histidinol-phosphatase [Pseudomonadota bacterium]
MSATDSSEFIALANRLADASGAVIRPHFRQPVVVGTKVDASPVTEADRDAEQTIRSILSDLRPADGIIGEEFGNENIDAEYVWVIDPIDGTKSFITGRPIFGTLIALTRKTEPLLGVIDQPIGGERWVGLRGHGAPSNREPIRGRECPELSNATIGTTAPDMFDDRHICGWKRVSGAARHIIYGGDCYNYAQVASGLIDAVIESGLQNYDFAALPPIIQEAGGIITDWRGNPLTLSSDGSVVACGDKKLHAELLELLAD